MKGPEGTRDDPARPGGGSRRLQRGRRGRLAFSAVQARPRRTWWKAAAADGSDGERGTAAAGALRPRIVELEPGAAHPQHVVHRGAVEIAGADRVDEDR